MTSQIFMPAYIKAYGDSLADRWTSTGIPNMPGTNRYYGFSHMSEDYGIVLGGEAACFLLNLKTLTWSTIDPINKNIIMVYGNGVGYIKEDYVTSIGGFMSFPGISVNTNRIYSRETNTLYNAATYSASYSSIAVHNIKGTNDNIVVGGRTIAYGLPGAASNTVKRFNYVDNNYSSLLNFPASKSNIAITYFGDDIFLCGGANTGRNPTTETYRYNVSLNTYTTLASLPTALHGHTAVELNDKNILVTGGNGGIKSTFLYNTKKNTWEPKADMPGAKSDHTTFKLANGQILVGGGYNGSSNSSVCYIYG